MADFLNEPGEILKHGHKLPHWQQGEAMHYQGVKVEHHAWVIMPNHLHLIFAPKVPLETLMKAWKSGRWASQQSPAAWCRQR